MNNKDLYKKFTIAKSPFSDRHILPIELRKLHIRDLKPSPIFHDYHTIKWLRNKCNESVIKKSILTLFPNNGNPVIDYKNESKESKRQRLRRDWLMSHAQPSDQFKHIDINPKYFFNQMTFEKVLKLREIFLEFDEDGSRKMEINEIEEMFNTNKIEASIDELVKLFFKENSKIVHKEDIRKLYLDFYQFMMFALRRDQDFRLFMRKIKNRVKDKEKEKEEGKSAENREYNEDKDLRDKDMNELKYLPMSFNLVLDYFITKGKERNSKAIIEKGIEEIDKIISDKYNSNRKFPLDNIDEIENIPVAEYEAQLDKINFVKLIKEFSNLFRIKSDADKEEFNQGSAKKPGTVNKSLSKAISIDWTQKNSSAQKGESNKESEVPNIYSGLLSRQLTKESISKLNYSHLNKYHSLKLALEETKRVIDSQRLEAKRNQDYVNSFNSNSNSNFNSKSTLHYTGSLPQLFQYKDKDIGTFFSKNNTNRTKRKDYIPHILLQEINNEPN